MAMRDSLRSERESLRFLPEGGGEFLRRRLQDLLGVLLVASGLSLLLACFSYDPSDPSFNRAAGGGVMNLLGRPGAYAADLLLQSLGLAAFLAAMPLAAWGWRILRDRRLPQGWLRLAALPILLLCAAVGLSALPEPDNWPLASGLGGFSGGLLLAELIGLTDLSAGVVALGASVLALLLFAYLLAMPLEEWRFLGRGLGRGTRVGASGTARGLLWLGGHGRRWLRGRRQARREPAEAAAPLSRAPLSRAPLSGARGERREPQLLARGEAAAARPVEIEPLAAEEEEDEADELVAPRLTRPAPARRARVAQGSLDLAAAGYEPPPVTLLAQPKVAPEDAALNRDALEKNARLLEGVLEDFGVRGQIVKVRPGPVVTRYELEPAPGTKTSRVVGLADDIARSMSAVSVRVAVVPGSNVIGIELPNARRETVYLRELLSSETFEQAKGGLPLILGKDIGGNPQIVDLARMPHLLVAGTTGSGKSVALNAMILSLLYRLPPEKCRFIMVDPKMLELSVYDDIPHLLAPVVTEPKKAIVALKWTVREMEGRYRAMSRLGVRNIDGYNGRIEEARQTGEVLTRRVQTGFDPDTGQPVFEEEPFELEPLPYIVVVVDEMADLMLVAGKEVEAAIQRLAQMARAAGIHIIMATQRPSVDVITGTIKANFPTRISFHVTSRIDSRTILGESGGEHLLGQGDMLYMAHGGRISRVHGPFVSDREVEQVVAHLKSQGHPSYVESVTEEEEDPGFEGFGGEGSDDLFDRAVAIVAQHRKASTSFIQRQLQIGYNRAARLVEQMEAQGMVGPANHVGKREVLLPQRGQD